MATSSRQSITPAATRLLPYQAKRDFGQTPEPAGHTATADAVSKFVVQKHWAGRLHYDFRLELDGVLKSWAVPNGPSLDPSVKRMAVQVEDHPVDYGTFEGTIPRGQYGAGRVIVWDRGRWQAVGDAHEGLLKGSLKFELSGHKLRGRWALVRMKGRHAEPPAWLLLKDRDAFARAGQGFDILLAAPDSVLAPGPAGAAACALPPTLAPQLATRAAAPPLDGADWLFEIKFDGYRLLARIEGAQVQLLTRNGLDWTPRLPTVHQALCAMRLPDGWYDGELIAPGADGMPDFGALQRSFDSAATSAVACPLVFHVFDLPYADGWDLRHLPLVDRRARLAALLALVPSPVVRFSAAFNGAVADVLASACRLGLEGVIAKRKASPYRSVRSGDWIKLKCGQRAGFVIGGYTEGKGSRAELGALVLGAIDDTGRLGHVGQVGTGFDAAGIARLLACLRPLHRSSSPFVARLALAARVHWVEPVLVADVSFAELTEQGHIRHGVFQGLREDPRAETAGPGVPAAAPSTRVTHPQRVIDAGSGATKLDLVDHYQAVATLMMVHLKQRPVALLRAPQGLDGKTFFQKHLSTPMPGLQQLDPALSPGKPRLIAVAQRAGLLAAAQWNVVEFHTQNAQAGHFEQPDRLVFDLDPGEGVPWAQVKEAALLTQSLLVHLGLRCFLKTSGGKGLHVVVPLRPQHGWAQVKGFSKAVVAHMSDTIPQRFVARSGPRNRIGRIFVDYLRNGRGATTVSAWSVRARPGLGVSVPVDWSELDAITAGDHWNLHNLHERLPTGNAPWAGYARAARSLDGPMERLGVTP